MRTYTKRGRSKRSERELARELKGRVQPASGALPVKSLKGDVLTLNWLIDDKVTKADSFGVKLSDWRKLREQAWKAHCKPALCIHFENRVRLFVVSQEQFVRLQNL